MKIKVKKNIYTATDIIVRKKCGTMRCNNKMFLKEDMNNNTSDRYLLSISFVGENPFLSSSPQNIVATFKSKRSAFNTSLDLIDNTVKRAYIKDRATNDLTWLLNK